MGKKRSNEEKKVRKEIRELEERSKYGERVLSLLTPVGNCNTNPRAYEIRQLLEDPHVSHYSHLSGLEDSWQVLAEHYGDIGGQPVMPRVGSPDTTAHSPMENFQFNVESGFYPPPEIMLIIEQCFRKYLSSGGDISLDEAFFGEPYKKRDSYAYRKSHVRRYRFFHTFYDVLYKKGLKAGRPKKSLEDRAEEYLSSIFSREDDYMDVDTFLRGYRRWKRDYGMS